MKKFEYKECRGYYGLNVREFNDLGADGWQLVYAEEMEEGYYYLFMKEYEDDWL